ALTIAGVAALVVVLVLGVLTVALGGDDETDSLGSITFDPVDDVGGPEQREGPPPAVEKALLARLDRVVAVRDGSGDVAARIALDVPATDLPQPPGAVAATLFRYNGRGQVVLVGPPGWLASSCLQVSVISAGLRPFDTSFA